MQRVRAKEEALHAYRDQERQALRFRAELEAREEWAHQLWRKVTRRPLPRITTVERAKPILDFRRKGETFDETPAAPVEDPTTRPLDRALDDLKAREFEVATDVSS